jgi:hypothetical protein
MLGCMLHAAYCTVLFIYSMLCIACCANDVAGFTHASKTCLRGGDARTRSRWFRTKNQAAYTTVAYRLVEAEARLPPCMLPSGPNVNGTRRGGCRCSGEHGARLRGEGRSEPCARLARVIRCERGGDIRGCVGRLPHDERAAGLEDDEPPIRVCTEGSPAVTPR